MKHKLKLIKRARSSYKAEFKCLNCGQPFAYYKPLTNAKAATDYVNKQLIDVFPCLYKLAENRLRQESEI